MQASKNRIWQNSFRFGFRLEKQGSEMEMLTPTLFIYCVGNIFKGKSGFFSNSANHCYLGLLLTSSVRKSLGDNLNNQ